MASLSDAERIDDIEMPHDYQSARRADYFLSQRNVVIELKSLETDPSEKIETVLQTRREQPDFPVFFGSADLSKVLEKLPDGDTLHTKIGERITRSVEDAFRSAKHQIADTKRAFGLPASSGLLVILNHNVDILSPQILGYKCRQLIDSPSADPRQLPAINFVWIIQATHYAGIDAGNKLVPSIYVESAKYPLSATTRLRIQLLAAQRAQFDGVPFVGAQDSQKIGAATSFEREKAATAVPLTQAELWRAQYRANPYMHGLSDEAFLTHTSRVFGQLVPFFAMEEGNTSPKRNATSESQVVQDYMSAWTHCLMEMNERMIDIRDLMAVYKGRHED
jgi:hypothetical protein